MGKAAPPATPPRPVRNTACWSGTAYSSGQARLISQLTLISGGRSPIRHVGTRRVGDGRPTAEVEAVRTRKPLLINVITTGKHTPSITSNTIQNTALLPISQPALNKHDSQEPQYLPVGSSQVTSTL